MSKIIEDLMYSDEYADYIMKNADPEEFIICNGDSLLVAMESGYLFEHFMETKCL